MINITGIIVFAVIGAADVLLFIACTELERRHNVYYENDGLTESSFTQKECD